MELQNLIQANEIQKGLIETYLPRLKILYTGYEIFQSVITSDYIIFRKTIGQSRFDKFTVDIKTDIKVHYTQLCDLS